MSFLSQHNFAARGFGCKAFPATDVIKMTISSAPCHNTTQTDFGDDYVSVSFYQVINQCLPLPSDIFPQFFQPMFYKVTTNTTNIVFSMFQTSTCTGAPNSQIVGVLNQCVDGTKLSVGRRRLGGAQGVVFEPAVPGIQIAGTGRSDVAGAAVGSIFGVFAVGAVAFMAYRNKEKLKLPEMLQNLPSAKGMATSAMSSRPSPADPSINQQQLQEPAYNQTNTGAHPQSYRW